MVHSHGGGIAHRLLSIARQPQGPLPTGSDPWWQLVGQEVARMLIQVSQERGALVTTLPSQLDSRWSRLTAQVRYCYPLRNLPSRPPPQIRIG